MNSGIGRGKSCTASAPAQPQASLSKALLDRHSSLYDLDKEHYKAQLKVHELQMAAQQLGFDMDERCFKPDKWQYGARRRI